MSVARGVRQRDPRPAARRVLVAEAEGFLADMPAAERSRLGGAILDAQDPASGLFVRGTALDGASAWTRPNPAGAAVRAKSLWSLHALDALDAPPAAPLRYIEDVAQPHDLVRWLEQDNWESPVAAAERIAFLMTSLLYQGERLGDTATAATYHRVLNWLESVQQPATGLWGRQGDVPGSAHVVCAGWLVPFFEYVHRPVRAVTHIRDWLLHTVTISGIPDEPLSSLACAGLMTWLAPDLPYRGEELRQIATSCFGAGPGVFPHAPTAAGGRREVATRLAAAMVACAEGADSTAASACFRRWPCPAYARFERWSDPDTARMAHWRRPFTVCRPEPAAGPAVVTVVIPCYDQGRYLHEAVESVLAQSQPGVELVIVDDGSRDGYTRWLMDESTWPGATVVRQTNAGVAAARNRGIAEGTGRYVCCLDADDCLHPDFMSEAVALLDQRADVGIVSAYYRHFDNSERIVEEEPLSTGELLARNRVIVSAVFRREAWEKAGGYFGGFSDPGVEDWDLWLGMVGAGYGVACLPRVRFAYRVRPGSMSAAMLDPDRWQRMVREMAGRHAALYADHLVDVLAHHGRHAALQLRWLEQLDEGRAWLQAQMQSAQREAERLAARSQQLEQQLHEVEHGRGWLDQQWRQWRHLAEERERTIVELRGWVEQLEPQIRELETGRGWLETQWREWQRIAGAREKTIVELRGRIEQLERQLAELEKGRGWLETQWQEWQRIAGERETIIGELRGWIEQLEQVRAVHEAEAERWRSIGEETADDRSEQT